MEQLAKQKKGFADSQPQCHTAEYRKMGLELMDNQLLVWFTSLAIEHLKTPFYDIDFHKITELCCFHLTRHKEPSYKKKKILTLSPKRRDEKSPQSLYPSLGSINS